MLKAAIILCFLFGLTLSYDKLKFVQVLWRHGDRTPGTFIPTDLRNGIDSFDPPATFEVTQDGINQGLQLGRYLRKRSTDRNRTLTSAQANMAGFYEGSDRITYVPIHTTTDDMRMEFTTAQCPRYEVERAKRYAQPYLQQYEADTKDKHPDEHPNPAWLNESVHDKIMEIFKVSQLEYRFHSSFIKYFMGFLLYDINELLLTKSTYSNTWDPSPDLKFYGVSTHDSNIQGLLTQFVAFNDKLPPLAAAILIELWENQEESYVKVFYRNNTDNFDLVPIQPSKCSSINCSLIEFVARNRPWTVSPETYFEECFPDKISRNHPESLSVLSYDHRNQYSKRDDYMPTDRLVNYQRLCILLAFLSVILIGICLYLSSQLRNAHESTRQLIFHERLKMEKPISSYETLKRNVS